MALQYPQWPVGASSLATKKLETESSEEFLKWIGSLSCWLNITKPTFKIYQDKKQQQTVVDLSWSRSFANFISRILHAF